MKAIRKPATSEKTSGPDIDTQNTIQHTKYTVRNNAYNIDEKRFNELNQKYKLLLIDSDRIYRAYQQMGILHAEILLDQPASWRQFLLNVVYNNSVHPDVLHDIKVFLTYVEMQSHLKGAVA